MFKLFIALNILLLNLLACEGGYNSCILKVNDSKSITNQSLQIPLKKNQKLVFSLSQPNAKVIKHDPFLNLYLIEDRKSFKYPFIINMNSAMGIASVDKKMAIEGRIVKGQVGLNNLATFSEPLFSLALLLNSCCSLEGIVTPRGIIEKEYLQRFIVSEISEYGDIGIRVFDKGKRVVVQRVNIFLKNNPFKEGDIILSLDGLKVRNSALFMKKILFSKIGKSHKIEVQRDSKKISYFIKTQKRYGGGYISDTFLEKEGIYFSENLTILRASDKLESYGLKIGDRLIQIDGKKVSNLKDISKYISAFKSSSNLLFQRDGFQFFIKMRGII